MPRRRKSQVEGVEEYLKVLRRLPDDLAKNALASAARAGAVVVQKEAKGNLAGSGGISFKNDVVIKKRRTPKGKVEAVYDVGANRSKPQLLWLEYGTQPHEIAADVHVRTSSSGNQRPGRRFRKKRYERKELDAQSLVATPSGDFMGRSVMHPGQPPRPWFRPAFDNSRQRAFKAMGQALGKALIRQARKLATRAYGGRVLNRRIR